jgi:hypothetical protein
LANAQDIVFAVGTGTSAAARRTSLYVTSGSLVGVSGSMDVKGNSSFTGSLNISGSAIRTNNFLIFDGSPNEAGPMSNFVALQMNNKEIFGFNNILQSELTSGSNFNLGTQAGINYTDINFKSAYGGTEASFKISNGNGTRNVDVVTDTMTVTGSLNVTGSVSIADAGDLTMYGHKMFNGAQYSSLQTLSGSANVSQSVYFDTTGPQFGVSLVDNTKLTVANSGTYNIQFSAQLLADTGADNTHIWFKKNGTNIAGSATQIALANNEENVVTVNILDTAVANDYYEIAWQNSNGDAVLLYEGATGNIPSIPSVITTVTQVR